MDKLTDFNDTSDVSDAAIRAAADIMCWDDDPSSIRDCDLAAERGVILAARLIQQHRPDLLVDPVDAAVDVFMNETGFVAETTREAAKRLYLMGLEAGKKS